jgi:phosphoglycolate phosphatase
MSPPPVRAVLFDLDGTLVQTRVASWEIFSRVNDRFGLGVDEQEQYFELFRGNIYASIRELCRDEAHAAEVKAAFLTLLREEYTPPLVPGVADVVRRLAAECTLAVMSSNATQVLRRVLEGAGLAFCFAHVFGGDVIPDKRAAIRAFLADAGSAFGRRCSADYDEGGRGPRPDPSGTVLVTDTAGDVRDALEAGIRVIGVAWGMHSVADLTAAGAEFVALWPQEIASHLLGDAAAHPPAGACVAPAAEQAAVPTAPYPPAAGPAAGRPTAGQATAQADPPAAADPLAVNAARRARRRAATAALGSAARPATPPTTTVRNASGSGADELLAAIRRVVPSSPP